MIDIEACTDGYNEDWKVQLRDKLISLVAKGQKYGAIETKDKFWTYVGINYATLGICYNCKK